MQAFVVKPGGGGEVVDSVPVPVPGPGEALVRVLIAGVCNTDLEILKGYMGFEGTLGHEFVGVCESAPDGFEHLVKKRVVGDINLACRQCDTCSLGGTRARNHCPNRTVLGILGKGGTYAEWLTLPAVNLHVVPDGVSTRNAAFTEPLAAAFRIVEQGLLANEKDEIAIVGDGKLGILIAEVVGSKRRATLLGRHWSKLNLVKATNIEKMLSEDALPSLAAKFDVVVDATGSPSGLDIARQLCRPMGTLVLKSTCAAGSAFNTAPFVVDELNIVGSRCGPFEPALDLLDQGRLDLTHLIHADFTLDQAPAAIAKAAEKGIMKVFITTTTTHAHE